MDHTLNTELTTELTEQPILCLDTTGKTLMAAIIREGELRQVIAQESTSHRYHSAILIPTIQQMLTNENLKPQDLKAVAVNVGPGSFTGIRTGLTCIRTMAQVLDCPVYTFNTFELIASHCALSASVQTVAIYLDALRGRAYYAAGDIQGSGIQWRHQPALLQLTDHQPVKTELTIASGKFTDYDFQVSNLQPLEQRDYFAPKSMLTLLIQNPKPFEQNWQTVQPLYLQQPNITIKKPRVTS